MSVQLSEASHPEHQLQIHVGSFENLSTIRRVVGEKKGFAHPLTQALIEDVNHAVDDNTGEFHTKRYFDSDAKEIYNALQEVAQTPDDKLNIEAADALELLEMTKQAKITSPLGQLALQHDEAESLISLKEYDWLYADKSYPALTKQGHQTNTDTRSSYPKDTQESAPIDYSAFK